MVLLLALVFAAANFVLVDLRLLVVTVQVRLAWAMLVPALLALAVGWQLGRTRRVHESEANATAVPDADRGQVRHGEAEA
jgi:hypothetical protein